MIKKQFNKLTIIHLAITFAIAVFIILFYFFLPESTQASEDTGLTLEMIIPLFAISSIAGGYMLGKQRIKNIAEDASGTEKMDVYRVAMIIRWATVEGAALFACIGYFISHRNNLILYATMIGVYLIYLRPIKSRVIDELKLSDEEAQELRS